MRFPLFFSSSSSFSPALLGWGRRHVLHRVHHVITPSPHTRSLHRTTTQPCRDTSPIVTRFAPSPTGYLHLGALRTALYNYLLARQSTHPESRFLLRIEDTDRRRLVPGSVQHIIDTLQWAGLHHDGPVHMQSDRTDLYREYVQQLLDQGHAYKCYCTPERLARVREEAAKRGSRTMYDRRCLSLTDEQRRALDSARTPFSVRMLVPMDTHFYSGGEGDSVEEDSGSNHRRTRSSRRPSTVLDDAVFGRISVQNDSVDDQILLKSDGFPTYHLANVVDDHLMGVTHVVRGMEWISSTPKHIMLYRMLGWPTPTFAHLPLLTTADGQKLSKRIGHASVDWYREQGFLAEALINFVAYLGWGPSEQDRREFGEVHSLQDLVTQFSLDRVNKGNCMVNLKKLEWLNSEHIRTKIEKDMAHVLDQVRPLVLDRFGSSSLAAAYPHLLTDEHIAKVLYTVKDRMQRYDQFADSFRYFFEDIDLECEEARKFRTKLDKVPNKGALLQHLHAKLEALDDDQFTDESIGLVINETKDNPSIGSPSYKDIVMLLRYHTTGSTVGAGINQTLATLGKELTLARIVRGLENELSTA